MEVLSYGEWRIHTDVGRAVDARLAGGQPPSQLRRFDKDGNMVCRFVPGSGPQNFAGAGGGDPSRASGRSGTVNEVPEWMLDVYSLTHSR